MTQPPRAALERFLSRLESRTGFAVAKQPDLWANLKRGGDWDLIVGDVAAARQLMVDELGAPLRTVRRSYVVATLYDWGKIDLLPRIEWQGVELLAAGRVLSRAVRTSDHGWPVACLAHQAVAAWIYPMLAHASFNARYAQLVTRAWTEDDVELAEVLTDVFGRHVEPVLAAAREGDPGSLAAMVPNLRRAARLGAISTKPAMTFRGMSRFAAREVALRAGGA